MVETWLKLMEMSTKKQIENQLWFFQKKNSNQCMTYFSECWTIVSSELLASNLLVLLLIMVGVDCFDSDGHLACILKWIFLKFLRSAILLLFLHQIKSHYAHNWLSWADWLGMSQPKPSSELKIRVAQIAKVRPIFKFRTVLKSWDHSTPNWYK